MKFLVLGGAGYIGSHFIHLAQDQGHNCLAYDDLSRGHRQSLPKNVRFEHASVLDKKRIQQIITKFQPDSILHFAAFALVGESMENPNLYYQNNTEGVRNLLQAMTASEYQGSLIFSSSCAVFGIPTKLPICEDDSKNPISPYGRSKLMAEFLIEDFSRVHQFRSIALRYFNACGAHISGDYGEDHRPETHLIPNIIQAAMNGREVKIFGGEFPTEDGSCVRDYIHISDIAAAHLQASSFLKKKPPGFFDAIHLGTGKGYSNLQVLQTCERVMNQKILWKSAPSRPGDPAQLFTDNSKAKSIIGFSPSHSDLHSIIKSAAIWHQKHPLGYG